ncbi:MAG: metal ABC transporter substrate-binding protein [Eubacteriales bacterium]|nr:metal ABC transporter substrate-binding protein [Eubacteriales bacterium]
MNQNRYQKICQFAVWLLLMAIIVSGCGQKTQSLRGQNGQKQGDQAGVSSEDSNEKTTLQVVTSFYPMYIMVWNLVDGVEGVELSNMAKPSTGCLHDYQLRPKDVVCLDGADLFFINGAGMENFLDDILEAYDDLKVCQAVDALDEEDFIVESEEHEHDHEDMDHEESGHDAHEDMDHEDVDHDHDHGDHNPHTWLDPALYRKELAYFKDILQETDPAHAEEYQKNYQEYDAKIQALQEEFHWHESGKSALILHESFPYLLRTSGITIAGAAEVEKDSGFSAHEIVHLVEDARECGAQYILSDSQYSGRISDLLSEETGMEVWKLDSCVSGAYEKDAYIKNMRRNYQIMSGGEADEDTSK